MRKRVVVSLLIPFMFMALSFVNGPTKATAWDALSYCPSSYNSYWTEASANVSAPSNEWAVRELCFGFFYDMGGSEYKWRGVATSNFTWPRYNGFNDPTRVDSHPPGGWGGDIRPSGNISTILGISWPTIYGQHYGNWPETGDVIVSVQAVAYWPSFHTPYFYFTLYHNGFKSYPNNQSTGFAASSGSPGNPYMYSWNVTAKRIWTPADFSNPNIVLGIECEIYPGIFYGLDYLGFVIEYVNNTAPSSWNIGNMILDIQGSLGVIGFIGMTVCPAYAVIQWRQGGDGRIVRLLMSVGAMLVFFTLFLASLGA